MRAKLISALIFLLLGSVAQGQETPGFHPAVEDCLATIANINDPFLQAGEVEGDAQTGFVAWYHDSEGQPIYAVRLGVSGSDVDQVISCQGPAPMGPTLQHYVQNDQPRLEQLAAEKDLLLLDVPAEGNYYANCENEAPNLLIAITFDATSRVAVQVVKSAGVAETCERFEVKDQ